jgi:hypothetical protein
MGKILFTMICFFSSSVFAGQKAFDLKMELSLEGKHISSPKVIVKEGETKTIVEESNGQKTYIEVSAKQDKASGGKQTIYMAFVIGKIASDGSKTVISTPRITAAPNETAQISIGEKGAPDLLSLSVIANETML